MIMKPQSSYEVLVALVDAIPRNDVGGMLEVLESMEVHELQSFIHTILELIGFTQDVIAAKSQHN